MSKEVAKKFPVGINENGKKILENIRVYIEENIHKEKIEFDRLFNLSPEEAQIEIEKFEKVSKNMRAKEAMEKYLIENRKKRQLSSDPEEYKQLGQSKYLVLLSIAYPKDFNELFDKQESGMTR